MTRRVLFPALSALLLLTSSAWAAPATDCDCTPRRLLSLLDETSRRVPGQPQPDSFTFASPTTKGDFYLTVVNRPPQATQATIALNGEELFSPEDFAKGFQVLRAPISVEATNTLEVEVGGTPGRSLQVMVHGIVLLDDLGQDSGDHLFEATPYGPTTFHRHDPPSQDTDAVILPTTEGLFWLRMEQGLPPVTAGTVDFNSARVLRPEDFKTLERLIERPVIPGGNDQFAVLLQSNPQSSMDLSVFGWLVDNEPPVVSWEAPRPAAIHGPNCSTTAEVTYTDATSGVSWVELSLNGHDITSLFNVGDALADQNLNALASNLVEGDNTLSALVKDRACNETVETVTFVWDSVPPEITWNSPADGSITGPNCDTPLSVSYTDATSGVDLATVQLFLNGQDVTDRATVGLGESSMQLNGLSDLLVEGENTLGVALEDRACNPAEAETTFIWDVTPPELTIASPAPNAWNSEESTASVSATDNFELDLSSYRFFVHNTGDIEITNRLDTTRADVNFVLALVQDVLVQGDNALRATITDQACNETEVSVPFRFDSLAPEISLSPEDNEDVKTRLVDFAITYNDPGAPQTGIGLDFPDSLTILIDGNDRTADFTLNPNDASLSLVRETALDPGDHVLEVTIRDLLGHETTERSLFTVDPDPAVALELSIPDIPEEPMEVGEFRDLTIRALTAAGEPAEAYVGLVTLDTTDPESPMNGVTIPFDLDDWGERTIPDQVVFLTSGLHTLTGTDLLNNLVGSIEVEVFAPSVVSGIVTTQGERFRIGLDGVTVSFAGRTTRTDESGRFELPVDETAIGARLILDGRTAGPYPKKVVRIDADADLEENVVGPFYLARLPEPVLVPIDLEAGVTLRDIFVGAPGHPGCGLFLPAGTGVQFDGLEPTSLVSFTVQFLTPEELAVPLPPGVNIPLLANIEPSGLVFPDGIHLCMPNETGLAAGTIVDFYRYGNEIADWEIVGQAEVDPDGETLTFLLTSVANLSYWGGGVPTQVGVPHTVTGRVVTPDGSAPDSASTTVRTFSTTNQAIASDGTFSISLGDTPQVIKVIASGVRFGNATQAASNAFSPDPSGTTDVGDVTLEGWVDLTGTVTYRGRAMANATVESWPNGVATTKTDGGGAFALTEVPETSFGVVGSIALPGLPEGAELQDFEGFSPSASVPPLQVALSRRLETGRWTARHVLIPGQADNAQSGSTLPDGVSRPAPPADGNFDGDVDGLADLVWASPGHFSEDGSTFTGQLHVKWGEAGGFSSTDPDLNIFGPDEGSATFPNFGASLAVADVNGDDFADILVGAPNHNRTSALPFGGGGDGIAYLILGRERSKWAGYSSAIQLNGVTTVQVDKIPGVIAFSDNNFDDEGRSHFGRSVAIGNMNGDPLPDLLIGAPEFGSFIFFFIFEWEPFGRVFQFNGENAQSWDRDTTYSTPELTPDVTYSRGVVERFGQTITAINADGGSVDQLLIGASGAVDPPSGFNNVNPPRTFLYRAQHSSPTSQKKGVFRTANLGDLDDDGQDEFAILDPSFDTSNVSNAGRVFVFGGSGLPHLGSPQYTITGSRKNERLGIAAAGVGDLNCDSFEDFVVSALEADESGSVHLFSGATDIFTNTSAQTRELKLRPQGSGEDFGEAVGGVRDFNGDGAPEVVIGAPGYNSDQGRLYVTTPWDRSFGYSLPDGVTWCDPDGDDLATWEERFNSSLTGHNPLVDDDASANPGAWELFSLTPATLQGTLDLASDVQAVAATENLNLVAESIQYRADGLLVHEVLGVTLPYTQPSAPIQIPVGATDFEVEVQVGPTVIKKSLTSLSGFSVVVDNRLTIQLTVEDAAGNPVPDAFVFIEEFGLSDFQTSPDKMPVLQSGPAVFGGLTDSSGKAQFFLPFAPPDVTLTIARQLNGYPALATVDPIITSPTTNGTVTRKVTLVGGSVLEGTVVSAATGLPIPGAVVEDLTHGTRAITAGDGSYELVTPLESGDATSVQLRAEADIAGHTFEDPAGDKPATYLLANTTNGPDFSLATPAGFPHDQATDSDGDAVDDFHEVVHLQTDPNSSNGPTIAGGDRTTSGDETFGGPTNRSVPVDIRLVIREHCEGPKRIFAEFAANDQDSSWSITGSAGNLKDGTYEVQAFIVDPTSTFPDFGSNVVRWTLERTTPPAVPVVTSPGDDDIFLTSASVAVDGSTPATSNLDVTVRVPSTNFSTTQAGVSGAFSVNVGSLPEGTPDIIVEFHDSSGTLLKTETVRPISWD